jgi:hypothetical protein
MKLSRNEVCKRVPIGLSTFDRWAKSGKLEVFRDGTLTNAKKEVVWASLESLGKALGIADDTELRQRLGLPTVTHDVTINVNYDNPQPERVPDIREPDAFRPQSRAQQDREFAEKYRSGEATDSAGNKIDGTNSRWPLSDRDDGIAAVTLLGPTAKEPKVKGETQNHMEPGLLSDRDENGEAIVGPVRMGCVPSFVNINMMEGEGFTRRGATLAKGLSQEQYDKAMHDWERSGGGPSEQEKMVRLHRSNISAAFPTAEAPGVPRYTKNGGKL